MKNDRVLLGEYSPKDLGSYNHTPSKTQASLCEME